MYYNLSTTGCGWLSKGRLGAVDPPSSSGLLSFGDLGFLAKDMFQNVLTRLRVSSGTRGGTYGGELRFRKIQSIQEAPGHVKSDVHHKAHWMLF